MITTLVSCYNHGKYLKSAVESCLVHQKLKPTEVILINDGSTDETQQVIEELAKTHPEIVPIRHETNKGNIHSYNEGIDLAHGDFFHLMAADDLLMDHWFYFSGFKKMNEDPEVGMVSTGLTRFDENDVSSSMGSVKAPFTGKIPCVDVLNAFVQYGNFINGGGVLIRTSIQRKIGHYDSRLRYSADYLNWIKAMEMNVVPFFLPEIGYWYRSHKKQMTFASSADETERQICEKALIKAIMVSKYGYTIAPIQNT